MWWSTTVPPAGWLICNNQAVNRTTYATLFALIGTTFGVGNGSTTFNVPDFRDRFPVGAGTTYAVNATGGESTHSLNVAELAAHTHTWDSGTGVYAGYAKLDGNVKSSAVATSITGSGTAHENKPPYRGIAFIIKT